MSLRALLVPPVFLLLTALVGCDTGAPANPQSSDKPPANLPQPVKPVGPAGAPAGGNPQAPNQPRPSGA